MFDDTYEAKETSRELAGSWVREAWKDMQRAPRAKSETLASLLTASVGLIDPFPTGSNLDAFALFTNTRTLDTGKAVLL